jgi:hypothetical protein
MDRSQFRRWTIWAAVLASVILANAIVWIMVFD